MLVHVFSYCSSSLNFGFFLVNDFYQKKKVELFELVEKQSSVMKQVKYWYAHLRAVDV